MKNQDEINLSLAVCEHFVAIVWKTCQKREIVIGVCYLCGHAWQFFISIKEKTLNATSFLKMRQEKGNIWKYYNKCCANISKYT